MNRRKGYTYALLAQLGSVIWAIFAIISFKYYNVSTTIVIWFASGAIFGTLLIIFSGKFKKYMQTFRDYRKYILISTIFDAASVLLSFYVLKLLGASLQGFLGNISILIIIFLSIMFLNEKFNMMEAVGGIIAIIGLIIITFTDEHIIFLGLILIIIQSVFSALSKMITKSKLTSNSSLFLAVYRATFVFIFSFIFALATGQFDFHLSYAILFTTIPPLFTVLLGNIFVYKSYKYLELSKASIINAIGPFLVAISAFIFLGEILTTRELIGGIVIVIGITFLSYFRSKEHEALKNNQLLLK